MRRFSAYRKSKHSRRILSPPSGWEVEDIATQIAELRQRGVILEHFDGIPQDETGVWTTPEGAKVAWFKDPDGNLLSLTQFPT